ncbi:hypothetical protein [Nocardia sp. NPDC057440]|uniref:hypothetical protein n=1 Tax=Nocardia sp. NPDC057440 TaxID=3346134 RepID=UPI00366D0B98
MSKLTKDEVKSRILHTFKAYNRAKFEAHPLEARFIQDFKLHELDLATAVIPAIEEEFCIEIPHYDADEIQSIADAIEYVVRRDDAD